MDYILRYSYTYIHTYLKMASGNDDGLFFDNVFIVIFKFLVYIIKISRY